MSAQQVDNITNAAGTGAPTFPFGITSTPAINATGSGITVEAARASPSSSDVQNVYSGTYVPVFTNVLNSNNTSPVSTAQWMRVGNVVTVAGLIDVSNSAGGGADSNFELTLPVASDFSTIRQCAGTFSSGDSAGITVGECGRVIGNSTSNRAAFGWYATATVARTFAYTYTYLVI